jgi:hypothetical protein
MKDLGAPLPDRLGGRDARDALGRAIEGRDAPFLVDREDAVGDRLIWFRETACPGPDSSSIKSYHTHLHETTIIQLLKQSVEIVKFQRNYKAIPD